MHNNTVKITFDPVKDAANIAKHGLSLALTADLEWDTALVWPDIRKDYGEIRMRGIGYIHRILCFIAFVDRNDGRRIISLRKANAREEKGYAKT